MTFIKVYNLYKIQATRHNCQIFVKTQVLWKLLHFVYDIFELLSQIIDDSVVFSKTYNLFQSDWNFIPFRMCNEITTKFQLYLCR